MARGTGTSRNRTRNGIRTRFLDQVSIAPFRPADLLTLEVANYLALNNTFYADADSQTGNGSSVNNQQIIDGTSQCFFRNVNIASVPSGLEDQGHGKYNIYINGLFLEKNSIDVITNIGNDIYLRIFNELASLENNLDPMDLITITGKILPVP